MRRFVSIMSTCCVLAMCGSLAFAGEQMWTFDSDATDWEPANGVWEVVDGAYQVTGGEAAMHSLIGDVNWTDYTLDAKVRLDDGDWAGIVFRAQNEFEYYVCYLNVANNKSELWRHKQGGFDARDPVNSNIVASNVTIVNGEWFDVQVAVEGDTFQISINGELQAELSDTTGLGSYGNGKIGVFAWQTAASFDDIRVSGDDIPGATSVQPQGKLATAWGKLKRVD